MGEEDPGLTTVYYSVLSPADVAKVRSWTWVLKCAVQTMTCSFLILSRLSIQQGPISPKGCQKMRAGDFGVIRREPKWPSKCARRRRRARRLQKVVKAIPRLVADIAKHPGLKNLDETVELVMAAAVVGDSTLKPPLSAGFYRAGDKWCRSASMLKWPVSDALFSICGKSSPSLKAQRAVHLSAYPPALLYLSKEMPTEAATTHPSRHGPPPSLAVKGVQDTLTDIAQVSNLFAEGQLSFTKNGRKEQSAIIPLKLYRAALERRSERITMLLGLNKLRASSPMADK